MRFQILSNKPYQSACIEPVRKELVSRGHTAVHAEKVPLPKEEIDATLIASVGYLHPGIVNKLKRPIFFLPHGVAVVKTTLYKQHKMADHMLMTGPIWKERMEFLFPKYSNNIEAGFPKSDELVNGKNTREEVIRELGLDPKEPIVVFAPSWDDKDAKRKGTIDALPAVESLGFKNLILCLHEYDKMFGSLEGKKIIKHPNKNRYLLAADLLIGDISSIMIEFTLLNKPMVHIDMTGNRQHYGIWEEPTYHYGTFQAGEFATPKGLPAAVKEALDDPGKYEHLRKYWKWRSFYNPGSAARSAADAIEHLTSDYKPVRKRFIFF